MARVWHRVSAGADLGGRSVWLGHTGTYLKSANRCLQLANGYYRTGRLVGSRIRPPSFLGYPGRTMRCSALPVGLGALSHIYEKALRYTFGLPISTAIVGIESLRQCHGRPRI